MDVLTAATRGGRLAVAQTEIVVSALKKIDPGLAIKIKTITTKGDRDKQTVLWNLKTSGFFTTQVENALLAGEADFAVHSFKDLPTSRREGLSITAVCERRFAADCLLAAGEVSSIEQLRHGAKIGTSSLRRAVQLRRLRADLKPMPIRGNVQTRLKKLDAGEFDAVVLARAGIERLGLANRISVSFDPAEFIPAPAQGALAVQTRSDDAATSKLIAAIEEKQARLISLAERQVLVTTQCGCHAPVGSFARIVGEDIVIDAFVSDLQGENFIRRRVTGPIEKANQLAEKLAEELLQAGGNRILESLENNGIGDSSG